LQPFSLRQSEIRLLTRKRKLPRHRINAPRPRWSAARKIWSLTRLGYGLSDPASVGGPFFLGYAVDKIVIPALLAMTKFFLALIAIAVAALIGAFVFAAFTL
jgi:hypothetical protein